MESTNTEMRGRLLAAKLRGLVGDHLGAPIDAVPSGFASGAGVVVDHVAWVLIDGDAGRSLGPALAWAIRHDATSLQLIAETSTGLLGRRAGWFDVPISVWFPEGRTLLPVVAEAFGPRLEPSDEHLALTAMIEEGGAEVNIEHGVVSGEVRGLEVCRVVDEATLGRLVDLGEIDLGGRLAETGVRLEVGVGATDREAFQLIHGDVPTVEALAGVVEAVRSHRSTDAPQHPLNRMAPERFTRWQACAEPGTVGMASLEPVASPVPRPGMKEQAPAVALGTAEDGGEHLVVFSSGVDLDVIPFALDAYAAATADVVPNAGSEAASTPAPASLRIVLRANDLVPITREIAERAATPIEFVTLG